MHEQLQQHLSPDMHDESKPSCLSGITQTSGASLSHAMTATLHIHCIYPSSFRLNQLCGLCVALKQLKCSAVSTSCNEDLQQQERPTFDGELCQLGLHILVQRSPLLQLCGLLLVAVSQVPQGVVQLHLHLSDDAHLQAEYATLQRQILQQVAEFAAACEAHGLTPPRMGLPRERESWCLVMLKTRPS